MSRAFHRADYMALDDCKELLVDMPHDKKWELIGGRVVKMMVGARREHHDIVHHLTVSLRRRGSGCRVFARTFFVRSGDLGVATLPDIVVRRGPLPAGAASGDRALASLQHDVLVDRDGALVEVFDQQADAWASLQTLEGLEAMLDLPALALTMPLAEISADVLSA